MVGAWMGSKEAKTKPKTSPGERFCSGGKKCSLKRSHFYLCGSLVCEAPLHSLTHFISKTALGTKKGKSCCASEQTEAQSLAQDYL